MNPLRIAASALFCTLTLVSQQAAAVEYALPAANSRLIGENQEYVVPADNRPLEQIAADFWALAGALGLSLLMSLLFAGWLMQKLIDRQARREERP